MLKKLILIAALFGASVGVARADTFKPVNMSTSGTLQAGTVGYAAHIASGTIRIFASTSAYISQSLTMPAGSTATFAGSVALSGTATASSMTVTDARFLAMTVNGAVKDRNLSNGTTFDYLLGGSSSTWSHAGLILQIQSLLTTAVSSATTSATFVKSGVLVTLTPKFATSKIRVSWSGDLRTSSNAGDFAFATLERNGSNLASGGGSNYMAGFSNSLTGAMQNPASFVFIDSPNSTSSLTYEIYFRTSAGGATGTICSGTSCQLIAEEIGQ